MKIVRASAFRQYQPFTEGPYVCRGKAEDGFDSTIVRLESDSGLVGWGEMAPLGSFYSAAFAGGARAGVAELLPQLLGIDPRQVGLINQMVTRLQEDPVFFRGFADVALGSIERRELAGLEVNHFRISCSSSRTGASR